MRATRSSIVSSFALLLAAACGPSLPEAEAPHTTDFPSEDLPAPAQSAPLALRKSVVAACGWQSTTCALESGGDVFCWGRIEEPGVSTPRRVAQVPDAVGIDCGSSDLWIVRKSGELAHVGFRESSRSSQPDPSLHGVVALRHVGADGVCALLRDGHVTCFGWLDFSDKKPSVTIAGIDNAAQLECSRRNCCAVLRDGGLRCFGYSDKDLGIEGTTARTPPVAVGLARSVAMGDRYACAVGRDGVRMCWGRASYLPAFGDASAARLVRVDGDLCTLDANGKLGCSERPLPSDLGEGITDVVDAGGHTCVVRKDSSVGCWGSNDYGELGDGIPLVRSAPARVAGVDDVAELNVAHTNVCARKKDGTTWCWGDGQGTPKKLDVSGTMISAQNAAGCTLRRGKVQCQQMNLGRTEWRAVSAELAGGPKELEGAAVDRAANVYLLDKQGSVSALFSTRDNGSAARVLPMSAPSKVHALVPTGPGACALTDGGRVACFFDDRHESDENFLTKAPASRVFREVPRITGAVQLAGGSSHACARTQDARVLCWNLEGSRPPREIEEARGASEIASNDTETCAVVRGEVVCWTPAAAARHVSGLPPVVHAGSGRESRCALDRDGHVWCWGTDTYGELGMGRQSRVDEHVVSVVGLGL